ncbi:methionyl-tRNA formyltransferase, partial [Streptomyces sp. SID10244]|nr:methionyl-tRNA formyltransferase [Streptomyces sp. SID10244]
MRIVTFGYQTWGHRTLEALIDSPHEVVLSVTHPPSEHAYETIWSDSVEDLARDHGIPVHLAQ